MLNRPRRSSTPSRRPSPVRRLSAREKNRSAKLAKRVLALRSLHPARLKALRKLKSRKPWTRKRALGWAMVPLFLLLLFIGGNTFIRQRLDVDNAVRRSILPELRRQLGRDIEVGRIESDYVSTVTLHDVVIGRDPKLAPGALARAKSIRLELDILALALGRAQGDPLSALHSVFLDQPQILLERDTRGTFNWANLWKGSGTTGSRWTGLIVVQNGRLWLRDATFRSLKGRSLLADLQGVNGRARFNGDAPVSFTGDVSSTRLGDGDGSLSNLQSNGSVAPDGRRFNLNLRWPQTPLAKITDYLLPNGDVKLQSGSAAGNLRLAWDASWPVRARWLYQGALDLQNISGQAKQLRLPGSSSPEPVQNLTGNLRFGNDALETAKLTGRVLDTPLQVSGRVALPSPELPRPAFDITAQSEAWNVARIKQLVQSVPALRGFDLQTARANAVIRASGDAQNPSVSTQFSLPAFTLSGQNAALQNAVWRGNSLRGRLEYDAKTKRTFARFSSSGAFLSQARFGTWRSRDLDATIAMRNGNAVSADVRAINLQAQTPQGNLNSRDVTAKIVSPDGRNISGLVRATALDARSSQGSLRSGDFVATFTTPNARDFSGAIRATDFSSQTAQGNLRGPLLTGVARYTSAARAASTQITANLAMPRFVLDSGRNAAMPVFAEGSDLRAAIQTSGNAQNLLAGNLIVNAQSDSLNFKHAQYGMGRAAQFVAAFSQKGNAKRVQLNGRNVALRPNSNVLSDYQNVLRGGVFGASSVQLAATSSGATWDGLTQFTGVDASRFNLASLGNNAQISNLGNLSGAARFWNVGGSNPMVKGRFALSQAQIQGESLRNLRGNISFAGDTLRLTDATAQTRWSTVRAEAVLPLRGGQTQFRLVAPRLVLGAAQLRPFLAPLGLALRGDATGRLAVENGSSSTRNAPLQLSFDLDLPSAALVPLQSGRDALRLRGARVRGSGLWSASAWNGTVRLTAARGEIGSGRLRGVNLPSWVSGTATRDLQLQANGRATRSPNGTWAMNSSATVQAASAQTPLPGSSTPLVWQNASATLTLAPGRIAIPRFSGQVPGWQLPGGDASTRALVTGHLEQRGTAWSGQLLAENLSAPRFTNWTQRVTGLALPVNISRGVAFARVDLSGTAEAPEFDTQLRVLDGALQKGNSVFPLDSARFVFRNLNLRRLTTGNARTVTLDEATIWSRGGRISANGTVSLAQVPTLNLQTRLDGVRVADAAQFAAQLATPRGTVRVANLTGLLSGDLNVSGTVSQPRVTGRAGLRLARVLGADFDEVTGDVNYDSTGGGRFALTNLTGRAADAALSGDLNVNLGEGVWRAKLQARGARTERALRLVEQLSGQKPEDQDSLPLRGVLNASLDVRGSLRDANGNFALRPTDGTVDVSTDTLRWRGRPLGALHAGLQLENGIAHISDLALLRAADGNTSTQETPAVSIIRVTGDIPLDADAPGLDAAINIENARLSLVRSTLEEVQSILESRGSSPANFERLMLRLSALPEDLEGELALKAQMRGRWSDPTLAVDFAVREVRAGSQPLPAVDAALNFEDGIIAIRRLDLRQTFGTGDDESETVIRLAEGGRIEPNGNITLDGEVLNANLSQLATWLPDLRGADGGPIVRGDVGLFVFQVRGNTADPEITGSIEAENLEYRGYTFDRLRLARFDLANGQLSVEPGALTIRKGRFQSSSAWGRLPWTWGEGGETPGPRRDAPMEVHLPLETRDFGALAGAFVPALANVDASSFRGSIDVTGTLANPQLAGAVTFENATFRADPATLPFAFGVTSLTGGLRFANGNQVLLEGVRGKLAKASDIKAPSTGNPPATQRDPRAVRSARRDQVPPPNLVGDFTLDGQIALDLDAQNFTAPGASLAAHRYNLKLALRKAEYSSNEFSGLRDISLDLNWQTGEGTARLSQNLNWNFSARGRDRRRGAARGELTSQANVVLASNFGTGLNALLRSRFDGDMRVRTLPLYWRGVGEGVINGNLKLDNVPQSGVPLAPVPIPPPRLPDSPSVAQGEQLQVSASLKPIIYDVSTQEPLALFVPVQQATPTRPATPTRNAQNRKVQQNRSPQRRGDDKVALQPDPSTAGLLRISGDLEVTQTEITGLPGGEATASAAPAPEGPLFDIRLIAGRDVRFTTSNLRAEFVGEMSIQGTPLDPGITGRFETRDGQIRFPRAPTRITEGELRLAITRDPLTGLLRTRAEIDVTATGLAGRYQVAAGQYVPYRITVTLRGPLDFGDASTQNLRIDVVSDPPLAKDEAFAQLTGTSVRDFTGGTLSSGDINEAYARSVISLLSAPLFTGIERTLEEALGLSSITLDYRFNEPLSVQFGKALSDRVYLSYRRSLSPDRPGGVTSFDLRIDYRLKNDIMLGFSLSEAGRKQLTIGKTFRF